MDITKTTSRIANRRDRVVRFLAFLTLLAASLTILPGGESTEAKSLPEYPAGPKVAVGTGFTYQGRLKDGANPANGQYDLQFKLYDALSGGTQVGSTFTQLNQTVTDGLFTVQLDFGANAFGGDARWLEIAVRSAGGGSYTTLTPRQPLTAVPYAMSLATGNSGAAISGTVPGPVLIVTNTLGLGVLGTSDTGAGVSGSTNSGIGGVFSSNSGIGTYGASGSSVGVYGGSTSGYGVYGTSGTSVGVRGNGVDQHGGLFTNNSTIGFAALQGIANGTPGYGIYGEGNSIGVWGSTTNGTGVRGATTSGYGVHGYSVSNGTGVRGESPNGYGVYGISTNSNGARGESSAAGVAGVYGSGNVSGYGVEGHGGNGVYGITSVSNGVGVRGDSTAGYGVYGVVTSGSGVRGQSSSGAGVYGVSDSSSGVIGNTNTGAGVYGYGASSNSTGVWGYSSAVGSTGVRGDGGYYGVDAVGGSVGIHASGPIEAGIFGGDVLVTGDMDVLGSCCAAGEGTFKIDHPLDPANKYLVQSAVQSADMMSIYNGNATTDAKGEAVVTLPPYVEALNKDFRYQLTTMGDQFAQARVSSKIKDSRFTIKTDKANIEVSWQVTGVRNDPYAQAHPVQPEVDKPADEKGKYLHPELYGQPENKGIGYEDRQKMEQASPKLPEQLKP